MSGYDKYVRGKVLGRGSFGQAVLVTNKIDGRNYVIKEIDISRMPKAEKESAEQEAKLLMALSHPNIVRCLECFTHQSKLCIVMDWCSEGDLYSICQKRRGMPLPEDTILDWFVQMCLGLKHVHDRKVLHRDIKTQNIFVSSGGLLKLGDFGVSKILSSTWQLAATAVGTPYYLSPEICQNKRYNQKSDIWSLGCVLYELTTGRHAFEAPSMRALIQKIIKGQYPPVPSNRSEALRGLIDRMLTLNTDKRPSINDILATPVMKARITKFLSATLHHHEFSHTIIHGKPQNGQLVVQHPPANKAPREARVSSGGSAQGKGAARVGPSEAAAKVPDPVRRGPSPSGAPNGQAAAAAAAVAAAARQRSAEAAAAARAKAQQAAREREEAAAQAAAAAAARREDEGRRQRELAAVAAHREVERMKLEDQRKKIEEERARLESERRKAEAARQEAERRARVAEEAARKAAAEDARRRAEAEAKRAQLEREARQREAERREKERKREEERARMLAARKDYYAQRQDAARNQAAVQHQLQQGQVQVFESPAPPVKRRPWQSPVVEEPAQGEPRPVAPPPQELTPEQRRAVWEEQRAAAERNRRAAAQAEGGLSDFLGVPPEEGGASPAEPRRPPSQERRPPPAPAAKPQAAQQQDHVSLQQAYERRRAKLEREAAEREQQIRAYQQEHWREMREAARRNRAAIMAEVGDPQPQQPQSQPQQQPSPDPARAGEQGEDSPDVFEFAAMVKDMQDVLCSDQAQPSSDEPQQCAGEGQDDDSQSDDLEPHAAAREGRFLLNGEEVPLSVGSDDSLAARVEALRCHLEEALGTQPFLHVYRRLEALSPEDDEAQVSKEFLAVLGPERLPYLQLIHQLIVCEETLYAASS